MRLATTIKRANDVDRCVLYALRPRAETKRREKGVRERQKPVRELLSPAQPLTALVALVYQRRNTRLGTSQNEKTHPREVRKRQERRQVQAGKLG